MQLYSRLSPGNSWVSAPPPECLSSFWILRVFTCPLGKTSSRHRVLLSEERFSQLLSEHCMQGCHVNQSFPQLTFSTTDLSIFFFIFHHPGFTCSSPMETQGKHGASSISFPVCTVEFCHVTCKLEPQGFFRSPCIVF